MPGMSKVQMCTICHKEECCKSSFKDIALALRFDYILSEYNSLSDAWRVYQGVALYREYRGIGGETKQLDVEPRPCQLCLVKIVNMAQSIYVVTSTVETGVTHSRELEAGNKAAVSPPPVPPPQTSAKSVSPVQQPGSVAAKERWSTDSKERWSTSPVKKQSDSQTNGHNGASKSQAAVNQTASKFAAKASANKNRRESPLTKSRESSLIKNRESIGSLSTDTQSASKECQTPSQTLSRPKRSGRSFVDRNPDFHMDISLRGDTSETDSLEGLVGVPSVSSKKPKKQISPPARDEPSVDSLKPVAAEPLADIPVNKTPTLPFLSETRPKRSTGRSLFERNPDFAMDIPFAKIVEQNWKAKNPPTPTPSDSTHGVASKKDKLSQKENLSNEESISIRNSASQGKKPDMQAEEPVTIKTEVEDTPSDVIEELWKTDKFRAEHLAKLDHALSSAGWSQAIRSGKNMEKEVFKNSNTESEYVAGINRLVAHFNRGNSSVKISVSKEPSNEPCVEKQSSVQQKQLNTAKIIKPGNEKLKTSISKMQVSEKTVPVLKEKRVVKPTKKILEKKLACEKLKGVKKVAKPWSKTKLNCPMCGQPQLKTKMKEHMLVFHKSSPQFPCIDCEFKSSTKVELGNHITTVHDDLHPEESVSESEGSISSQSITSSTESRVRANAVRSQFQYIVKTSKSGKQGRKYIEVGPGGGGDTSTIVPELCKNELKSESGQKPKAKKTPKAKKVLTPGSQSVDEGKKTPVKFSSVAEDVTTRQNGVLQYMKEDERSRVHEVLHEAAVSEKVVDEFAGSSSESEFSEPQSQIVGTLNAYYMNKPSPEEDELSALKIDSVSSVTPIKDIVAEKKATDPVERVVVEKNDTVAAKGIVDDLEIDKDSVKGNMTHLKENLAVNKERPQRRKRSIEDIHPDFVMDIPRSALKSDRNLMKKGKQEFEQSEASNVAKSWFEVNQGEEF